MNDELAGSDDEVARQMWRRFEVIHEVIYFARECRQAPEEMGLRGFFMGYFAFRAAPLGACSPDTAEALFYGFPRHQVLRALPSAWLHITPTRAVALRRRSAGRALRRIFDQAGLVVDDTGLVDLLWEASQLIAIGGRPLGAANRSLPRPADPLERLWQAATTLREHRGDGHVATLVTNDLSPVESHIVKIRVGDSDEAMLRGARRFSGEEWQAGEDRLTAAGVLDGRGDLTAAGHDLHVRIEELTDRLATTPWQRIGRDATNHMSRLLSPLSDAIRAAGEVPVRNPVGLADA